MGEQPIDYALVRSVDGVYATAFLTNRRLAVRIQRAGSPVRSGYDVALSKILGVLPTPGQPTAFSVAGRDKSSGEVVCVAFLPERENRACFLRHVQFCKNLVAQLQQVNEGS